MMKQTITLTGAAAIILLLALSGSGIAAQVPFPTGTPMPFVPTQVPFALDITATPVGVTATAVLEIEGVVERIDGASITVRGLIIDTRGAVFDGFPRLGTAVEVYAVLTATGFRATRIETQDSSDDVDDTLEIYGIIEAIDITSLTLGGRRIDLRSADIDTMLSVGMIVKVEFRIADGGTWIASDIEPASAASLDARLRGLDDDDTDSDSDDDSDDRDQGRRGRDDDDDDNDDND